jgi:hypothetical protein
MLIARNLRSSFLRSGAFKRCALRLQILFVLQLCLPISERAQTISFFPLADDPNNTFDGRAAAIIEYYGCEKDSGDITGLRNDLKNGNYGHQGEGLTPYIDARIELWYFQPKIEKALGESCIGLDRATLRGQINDTLALYKKHDQMGSTGEPCVPAIGALSAPFKGGTQFLVASHGEYDVDMREIVRALYMGSRKTRDGSPALDEATRQYIISNLLIAKGPPGPETYSLLYDCGDRENSTGSAQDYVDSQSWLKRAGDSLDDAGDYLLKRWLFLLALYFLGPLQSAGYHALFPTTAAVDVVPFPPQLALLTTVLDPFPFARVAETENHLLNRETTRYLTNKAMIAELSPDYPNLDILLEQQSETHDWLLHRLQRISKQEFDEYNSRPYARYSLGAITNLYDFTGDNPEDAADGYIKTAAQIILDFQTAKAALGSNRARRYAPFRRRGEEDGYDPGKTLARNLYNHCEGADHEVTRLLVLAGQTQLAGFSSEPQYDSCKDTEDIGTSVLAANTEWVTPAVSTYRLEDPIMELAVNRPSFFQKLHHSGVEIYSSSASFLLTGGGIKAPRVDHVFVGFGSEQGVSLPIVLIPTDGGLKLDDLIRIEGSGGSGTDIIGLANREDNACMADGFACGLNIQIPQLYLDCKDPSPVSGSTYQWIFINSAKCPDLGRVGLFERRIPAHPFYIAIAQWTCPGPGGGGPGVPPTNKDKTACALLEVYDAPYMRTGIDSIDVVLGPVMNELLFQEFRQSRISAFPSPDSFTPNKFVGTYHTFGGHSIVFVIPSNQDDSGGIYSFDGNLPAIRDWPLAEGQVMNSSGDGLITITSPASGKQITLDFRSWNAPQWSKKGY